MMASGERRSGQRVVLCGPLALKIATSGTAKRLLSIEEKRNRLAAADPFWSGLVVPVTRYGNLLVSRRLPTAFPCHESAAKRMIADRLNALTSADRLAAIELIDFNSLVCFADVASAGLDFSAIAAPATRIHLPVSSSHGDLFAGNMVMQDEQVALIDWDSYRPRSSFLLDALHFRINVLQRRAQGKSWTRLIFEEALSDGTVGELASRFGATVKELLLVYGLDRLSREIEQEGGAGKLRSGKLEKYVVLSRAFGVFSDVNDG